MSLPSSAQMDNMLIKKMQQVPFTNAFVLGASEAVGSSSLLIASKNVWSQPIPQVAPIDSSMSESEDPHMKYYTDASYIQQYTKLPLTYVNVGISFRDASTQLFNITGTNKLIGAIPSNYDPGGSYNIQVYDELGNEQDSDNPDIPWTFDGTSGYLTFFAPILFTPSISFWRYHGEKLDTTLKNILTGPNGGGGGGEGVTGAQGARGPEGIQLMPTEIGLNGTTIVTDGNDGPSVDTNELGYLPFYNTNLTKILYETSLTYASKEAILSVNTIKATTIDVSGTITTDIINPYNNNNNSITIGGNISSKFIIDASNIRTRRVDASNIYTSNIVNASNITTLRVDA